MTVVDALAGEIQLVLLGLFLLLLVPKMRYEANERLARDRRVDPAGPG
jgi:hypothetical protein